MLMKSVMWQSNAVMGRAQLVVLILVFLSFGVWAGLEMARPDCTGNSSNTLRNIFKRCFIEPSAFQVHWERTTINLSVRRYSACHTLNDSAPSAATCSDVKHNKIQAHL